MAYSLNLINIVGAFLIILLGLIASRIISNIIKKLIKEFEITQLSKKIGLGSLEKKLPLIIKYFIILISILYALFQLGISLNTIKIALIITIITTILFISLSFKDILPNLIAGISIKRSNKFKIGEFIKVKNINGNITKIGLLETEIKTENNEKVHIPNSLLKWS